MGIIKEHLKLLECYEHDDYLPKELEEIMGIPEARIRFYTKELFEVYNVGTLENLKLKIRKDKFWREKIQKKLEISSKDRRDYILIRFLISDMINLNEVSDVLEVSRRCVTEDLKNAKDVLLSYNLDCVSLNSKGIKIVGCEEDKKKLFTILLLTIFLEKDYLPKIYNCVFEKYNLTITEDIQQKIAKHLLKKGVVEHTYIYLQLSIIIFIGILRCKGKIKLWKLRYEINLIKDICKRNKNSDLLKNYSAEYKKALHFIECINKNSGYHIEMKNENCIGLITRMKLIEFKSAIGLKEIYLINRNFEKEYKEFYKKLMVITEEYFEGEIDSYDKISIFLLLKDFVFLKESSAKEQNIIVYKTAQIKILTKIALKLQEENIRVDKIVSSYSLESYLKNNTVKNILTFENIYLNPKINIIKSMFPLSEIDFLKIKKYLILNDEEGKR